MPASTVSPTPETAPTSDGAAVPVPPAPVPAHPKMASRVRSRLTARRAGRSLRSHAALILVLAAFAVSAFVVPTLTNVATTDDWGYTRSVEILLDEGRLTVLPAVAATAVFQILWGALFGTIFGMSLGVMRLATVVMVALGAIALYAMARDLGVTKGRAALGTAVYLFNPLTFSLAFSFMTDPYFTSLLIISTALYVHGVQRRPAADHQDAATGTGPGDRPGTMANGHRAIVAGSVVAGLAFLTRQQGALIPVGVALYLLAAGQLWPARSWRANLGKVALLLRVGGPTAVMLIGYYLWLRFFNEVPAVQTGFLRAALDLGWSGAWTLFRNLSFIELAYLGLLTLPIVLPAIVGLATVLRGTRTWGWSVFWLLQAVMLVGVAGYWSQGKFMPYIGQFFCRSGIGPPDVLGARPDLIDPDLRRWLTAAAVLGALLMLAILAGRVGSATSPLRSRAGLVLAMLAIQVVGILPPSFQYINRGYSLDRYLLPLLPLTIVLVLWALRGRWLVQPLGWAMIAAVAVFSVMGTRDYLVYMDSVWAYARYANSIGITNEQLDAGAAWDGYYLYTYGLENGISPRTPYTEGRPWWVTFYGAPTDSSYAISGTPRDGYTIVESRIYDSWLRDAPQRLFLLRRI